MPWTARPREIDYNLVRLRKTFRDGGQGVRTLVTQCARRGDHVEDKTCSQCAHQRGMCIDPVDRQWYRLCWRDDDERAPDSPPNPLHGVPVTSVMPPEVACVAPDASVETVAAVLLARGVDAAPVVDEDGRPLGLVSKTDLLRLAYQDEDEDAARVEAAAGDAPQPRDLARALGPGFHLESGEKLTARDVMTSLVFALPSGATLGQVAALMAYERVHHVVILGERDRVAGLVSSLDLAACIAR